MNALDRFEAFMGELMDRRVVQLMGARLQPVELAQAVGRCLEDDQSDGRAPHDVTVLASPDDVADLHILDPQLERKLTEYAIEHARERSLNFDGTPAVRLVADPTVAPGRVRAVSGPGSAPAAAGTTPAAGLVLHVAGSSPIAVDDTPFHIGRQAESGLHLPDARVSRQHAVIEAEMLGGYSVRDLNSHNGTFLNGQRVSRADLHDGDVLTIGPFELTIRL